MSKFDAITFIVVFLLIKIDSTVNTIIKNNVLHTLNDRIISVIDDLFVSLKINTKLIKTKNVEEYMAMHSFIQDVLHKNQRRYKEIRDKIKTSINSKTADQISGVNEVIDEMIREKAVNNISNRNDTVPSHTNATFKDIVDLVGMLKVNPKALTPNDFTFSSSNASLEVEGRRIFAGSSTGIARYPFMVSVHVAGRFVCAGSLLHESLALSAASCLMRVRDEPDIPIQIRVGSDYVTKMGFLVNIDRIIFNPDFDRSTLANNLVLLKTKKSLRFINRKVVAIKYDKWDSVLRDAKDIVILGWGRRGPSDKSNDDQPLSRARINLYDLEECKYIYTKEYVTDKTFCGGFVDRGEGACNHDGGGPALVGSLLTGIISFGSPRCGRVDAPTVFTRLGRYSDWIDSVLDGVTISKGRLANAPQTFEVPGTMEVGVGSEEMDAEKSGPENPREILEQEFGIRDILHGPIDTSKEEKIKPSTNATANSETTEPTDLLEREYDMTDILNGPIDKTKSSTKAALRNASNLPQDTPDQDRSEDADGSVDNTGQIELSDESEELSTLTPEDQKENKQEESKIFTDLMKHIYNSEILKGEETTQDSGETANFDDDTDNDPTTEIPKKSAKLALRIDNEDTKNKVPADGNFNVNFDTSNAESKDVSKSLETSQFDVQYQVEIKPILVPKVKNGVEKNSLIILSESGTTQRIAVNNAKKLKNKIKTAMKALIQQISVINSKEHTRSIHDKPVKLILTNA